MNNNIHSSSVISEKAKIGKNVKIGPFCLVGPDVILADGVTLHSHVVIEGRTSIGKNTVVFPFASIGHVPQDLKYNNEESTTEIGENNLIREYVTIQPGTTGGRMKTVIGNNCLLMAGTHIAHDCLVGNNVIFANLATLAGHVIIEDYVVMGGLSAVHQYVRIGESAMIGGCTPVIRDVAPFAAVTSERSGIEGMNLLGLKRRGFDKEDILNLQKAFKKIFFENDGDMKQAIVSVTEGFSGNILVKQLLDFMNAETSRSFTTANKK